MNNVVSIEERGWLTAEALADREGVSTRTIYNRLKRGEVEKRETESGARYRLKLEATEVHDASTETRPSLADSLAESVTEGPIHEPFSEATESPMMALVGRLEALAVANGRLQAERDQVQAELAEWKAFALAAVEEVERLRGY